MNELLEQISESLTKLCVSIENGSSETRTLNEIWGWNFPPFTFSELGEMSSEIAEKIKSTKIEKLEEEVEDRIADIIPTIESFRVHTMQYLFNGNAQIACPIYFMLLDYIRLKLNPIFEWQILNDNKALPNHLARRVRSFQAELDSLVPDKDKLNDQIKLISNATDTAVSLPTDLESLKIAKDKVEKLSNNAGVLFKSIDNNFINSEKTKSKIDDLYNVAEKLVKQCEEAYQITTTKGLAGAFDQRATKLKNTMWIWVGGLILALLAGVYIGSIRFEKLSGVLSTSNPNWGVIWLEFAISIVGLSAPIWFAWLATRQISQRFRLEEDYAFKASVAKAYEGYKKEAARIDPEFEARLFNSALTRLEEAPLRLVSDDNYSSPWHELFDSSSFKNALKNIPELKNDFLNIFNKHNKKTAINTKEHENKDAEQ